ncbi:hypothetical protein GCM10008090_20680 [Arenicella chitinivorans]|uniref:Tetratricopeptide repeat protein n=1 Tax=Arenicella chitinivorans TaxID=1329800 RepID=A0A918VMN8_9GAMM|nr:tetratricopeptide repeat protein [Arenicella chitinivorans]GHA10828.1 hypothetical protein GCM10008090_20680 [Arenicella chitinivorans]
MSTQIETLMTQAVSALREGKFDLAVSLTDKVIHQDADHPSAHAVKFSSLFKNKKFEQARQMGGTAAQLNPHSVFVLNNQACLQLEAKQPAAAAGLLKSLIDQFGERSQWLYNLALAHRMVGNYDYAITTFRRTLDHQPDHDRAAFQLADCLSQIGHKEEATRAYDYVRLLRTKHAPSHSNYIHHAVANDSLTEEGLRQEMRLWEERFIPKDNRYTAKQVQDKNKLRLGVLIGQIPEHWLLATVAPTVSSLAKLGDQVFVYWHDEKPRSDLFDSGVNVVHSPGFTDADFARQVRSDKIEVMLDVCGMRRGSRQRALGLQVAGSAFGWLAHEGRYATDLVELLDDRLTEQRFFVSAEYESYTPRNTPLPAKTFAGIGCQHGLSYSVIKVWSEILRRLPDWKLHLDATSALVKKLLIERFALHEISADRLVFDERLRAAPNTIVLDNFVQNDPIAAVDAIDHGGVLVALRGNLFPAQQSAALLKQLDRADWLCDTQRDYLNRAISLAQGVSVDLVDRATMKKSAVRDVHGFSKRVRDILKSAG